MLIKRGFGNCGKGQTWWLNEINGGIKMGKQITFEVPVDCKYVKPLGINGNSKMEWYCSLMAQTWEHQQVETARKQGCQNKNCFLYEFFLNRWKRVYGKEFREGRLRV